MDKSPWDSQNTTSILCVSQVLSQKAVLSFYKSMSPPPSPPNTMLKDQRNCALTASTLSVGWGRGQGRTVLVVRGYNFARIKKRSNYTSVPRLLSMIVGLKMGEQNSILVRFRRTPDCRLRIWRTGQYPSTKNFKEFS